MPAKWVCWYQNEEGEENAPTKRQIKKKNGLREKKTALSVPLLCCYGLIMLYTETWSSSDEALHFRLFPLPSQLESSTSVNLHTYSYPIMRQIHDRVQLCSLGAAQKAEFLQRGGGGCRPHALSTLSVGGLIEDILPRDGCHLCLPPTPPRPFLMKPDCLFCSASPFDIVHRSLIQ